MYKQRQILRERTGALLLRQNSKIILASRIAIAPNCSMLLCSMSESRFVVDGDSNDANMERKKFTRINSSTDRNSHNVTAKKEKNEDRFE